MKRNRIRFIILLFCLMIFQLFVVNLARAQFAANAQYDLWGDNMGDDIGLWWSEEPSSTTYVVYRSTSQNGPWQEIFRMQTDISIISGGKVDYTPDARLITLCYKIDALDSNGTVIRSYEPVCIPPFAG